MNAGGLAMGCALLIEFVATFAAALIFGSDEPAIAIAVLTLGWVAACYCGMLALSQAADAARRER